MFSNRPALHKIPFFYLSFLAVILCGWTFYVSRLPNIDFMIDRWPAALTMLFGCFVAGASPEGSAAVAYPVFTLLLNIPPSVARNFGFALQSIGMTATSLLIFGLRIKVEWTYIKFVTIGGVFGLLFGTYYVVPLVSPMWAKLFFVSLWLSFGIILWLENRKPNRQVFDSIQNFNRSDLNRLLLFGFVGGIISSLFGTGINIFTYCLMTIYYRVSEKVATPSSVIIMTIETLLGLFIHAQILHDFQEETVKLWLTCIPIAVIMAPLGAFFISKLPRKTIATLLYFILIFQFFGAMWVIKPSFTQIAVCLAVLSVGLGTFGYLAKARN